MTAAAVPVHRDASTTERAAQRRAGRWAQTLEAKVLRAVVDAGEEGLTAKEAREALGLPVEKHYSVAPRLSALFRRKGYLRPTGTARDDHQVYVATAAGRRAIETAA